MTTFILSQHTLYPSIDTVRFCLQRHETSTLHETCSHLRPLLSTAKMAATRAPPSTFDAEGGNPDDLYLHIISRVNMFNDKFRCKLRLVNHWFRTEVDKETKKQAQAVITNAFGDIINVKDFPRQENWVWTKNWYARVYSIAANKRILLKTFELMKALVENESSGKDKLGLGGEELSLLDWLRDEGCVRQLYQGVDSLDTLHYPNLADADKIAAWIDGLPGNTTLKVRLVVAMLESIAQFARNMESVHDEECWDNAGTTIDFEAQGLCLLTRGFMPFIQMLFEVLHFNANSGSPLDEKTIAMMENLGTGSIYQSHGERLLGEVRTLNEGTWDPAAHLHEQRVCQWTSCEDLAIVHACMTVSDSNEELDGERKTKRRTADYLARARREGRYDLRMDAKVRLMLHELDRFVRYQDYYRLVRAVGGIESQGEMREGRLSLNSATGRDKVYPSLRTA
jgi:hypothetical protein